MQRPWAMCPVLPQKFDTGTDALKQKFEARFDRSEQKIDARLERMDLRQARCEARVLDDEYLDATQSGHPQQTDAAVNTLQLYWQ
jgi:hypothetical protein